MIANHGAAGVAAAMVANHSFEFFSALAM